MPIMLWVCFTDLSVYDSGMDGRTLLLELYGQEAQAQRRAALAGGTAGMLTELAYPPTAHALWAEWQERGQPPGPEARLIPRWITAVTGTDGDREQLRRRAVHAHQRWRRQFPAEVDPVRFGREYSAADPVHLTAMHVIVAAQMLAALEMMYRPLPAAERDAYCAGCADTAGYAFGAGQAPRDYAGLRRAYEAILAGWLQGTSSGREVLAVMLAGQIAGEPAAEVARFAALLTDARVAACLDLDEALATAGSLAGTPA